MMATIVSTWTKGSTLLPLAAGDDDKDSGGAVVHRQIESRGTCVRGPVQQVEG